jgi:hypothetical protein
MKKKVTKAYVNSLFLCIILVGVGVFLFKVDSTRRSVKLTKNNIQIILSDKEYTNKTIELTVKYKGMASRDIKGYSFDGGKTWSKRNIIKVEDNQTVNIAVKDINDKIYKVDYEVTNIDKEGPTIEVAENIQVQVNSKVNLDNYIKVTDNGSGLRDEVRYTPAVVDTRKIGTQTIQVYAIDKLANKTIKKVNIEVTKNAPVVNFTKLSFDKDNIELGVGEENNLALTFEPKYASTSRVKWVSSDTNVVSVDRNGKVYAKGAGSATITASVDGIEATCNITVK